MILADIAVAGFILLMALVALVALPCFIFSVFGLFESFRAGSSGSRSLACVFFAVSGLALGFSTFYLVPALQLSREVWSALAWVLIFPAFFALLFFLYVRFLRRHH